MEQGPTRGNRGEGDAGFVAPPERVRLVYRPRRGPDEVELPLRMLVLGDFTGRPDPRPIAERQPIEVGKDDLPKVMLAQRLALTFKVKDTLSGQEGREIDLHLRFRRIADMEPEAVARQVPQLATLLALRGFYTGIKGPLGGEKAFRNCLLQRMNDPAARQRLCEEIGLLPLPAATPVSAAQPALPPHVAAAREQALRATHADALARLGEHTARPVRAAVAENPSTPPDVLFRLSWDFPVEVARNPVLPLLALEIPDWLSRLWSGCVCEVLRQGLIAPPEALLVQLSAASVEGLRHIAAGDPRTPPSVLASLAGDSSWSMRSELLGNPSLPLETWRRLVSDPRLSRDGARHPHAPSDWLRTMAAHEESWVRVPVAAHRNLPSDVLAQLAQDPDWSVRREIARRKDLPVHLVRALAGDAQAIVRGEIAGNSSAPPDLLPVFADDIPAVRNGLLGNPHTPPALRERILAMNRADWAALPESKLISDLSGSAPSP